MESPLGTVTELQGALTDLASREAQLDGIPDWMQELHDEHSTYQAEISAIEADLEGALSRLKRLKKRDAERRRKVQRSRRV